MWFHCHFIIPYSFKSFNCHSIIPESFQSFQCHSVIPSSFCHYIIIAMTFQYHLMSLRRPSPTRALTIPSSHFHSVIPVSFTCPTFIHMQLVHLHDNMLSKWAENDGMTLEWWNDIRTIMSAWSSNKQRLKCSCFLSLKWHKNDDIIIKWWNGIRMIE